MKTPLRLTISLALFAAGLYFTPSAAAQRTTSKLEIGKRKVYVVDSTNILKVDTLIMHNGATIQFDPTKYGTLEAKVAIIGNKCVISSKGADGKYAKETNAGEDGVNGGDMSIILNFESLGKLTIDARGGDGGAGVNGRNGHGGERDRVETKTVRDASGKERVVTTVIPPKPGTDGTDATMGGNGGSGGNILLMYSTSGFIPVFNQDKREENSIVILHTAGKRGRTGEPGKGGISSLDGKVKFSAIKDSSDGHVELINLDAKAN